MEPNHTLSPPTTTELLSGTVPKKRLSQWLATGICGNDITSSCLYVAAIAAVYAGVLAPLLSQEARSPSKSVSLQGKEVWSSRP